MVHERKFLAGGLGLTLALAARPGLTAPQPLVSYFEPIPIVGKLSTSVWGASTVGARDPETGLEDDGASGGVGPQQEASYFWDGKLVKGEDGKYHIYASHWAHAGGFSGWHQSIPVQAISDDIIGPYKLQGDCYAKNLQATNKGHNVTALVRPTGATPFLLAVGEIVPGQLFSSSSANGPWAILGSLQTNANGHTSCGSLSSNFTFTLGPDQRFWATSRKGCIMVSDQPLGPYTVQTDMVLPKLEDNNYAEDEVLWYSGGYFHIVYNYWNTRRAYHIMSKDGLSGWKSTGLAYQGAQAAADANSDWIRYSDGTVNHWHNVEHPGVYLENGHVTHFTFAVTDVDKDQAALINTGGSKVLVVPFNGLKFDCDNGDTESCQELMNGGMGGAGGAAGAAGTAGSSGGGTGGSPAANGGASGAHDAGRDTGGSAGAAAGMPSSGGGTASGAGGSMSSSGAPPSSGSEPAATPAGSDGCACLLGAARSTDNGSAFILFGLCAEALRRRRRAATAQSVLPSSESR